MDVLYVVKFERNNFMKKNIQLNYPKRINILGIIYTIEYVEKPSDVDIEKRSSLWGQIDYWTRTIRIYTKNRTKEDIWVTLLHEILHGISDQLNLNLEEKGNDDDATSPETTLVNLLSSGLFDTLTRNRLLKI